MDLDYTEFSFGYAFTENLIRWSNTAPTSAPFFPNLVQEGERGYDLQLNLPGVPIYFQFKLPQLMVNNRAFEIANHSLPGITVDFFRMRLMRRSRSEQHQKLIDLENEQHGPVFYATPMLACRADFDRAYLNAEVHRRSALFSPNDIGPLPDDEKHTIAYKEKICALLGFVLNLMNYECFQSNSF